jgi:RHS repeat-associated protein
MLVPNRHGSSTAYRYGFNGKEKDDELKGEGNSIDFGARMYDSRIGRWFAPDPLESKFTSFSTYNFSLNNPILYVDVDGKEIFIPTVANNKELTNTKYRSLSQRGRLLPADRFRILNDLQKQTNDKLKLTAVRTGNKIVGYLVEIESSGSQNKGKDYKKGTALMKNLITDSKYTAIAKSGDGTNATIPLGNGNSLIVYNADRKADGKDSKENGGTGGILNDDGTKGRPPFIGLNHELGHAENYKDTNLLPQLPMEEGSYLDPDSNKQVKVDTDEIVARKKDEDTRLEHCGEVHDGVEVKSRAPLKKSKS